MLGRWQGKILELYLTTFAGFGGHLYRPQMKSQEGNVFTPVYQSFCSQGCVSVAKGGGMHGKGGMCGEGGMCGKGGGHAW